MQFAYSQHFLRNYSKAPLIVQRVSDKQSALLIANPRHPSLDAKKFGGMELWQARINVTGSFTSRSKGMHTTTSEDQGLPEMMSYNLSFKIRLTVAGSACPRLAFIT